MAAFRNLIVHYYEKIDDAVVFGVFQRDLTDFLDLPKAFLLSLKGRRRLMINQEGLSPISGKTGIGEKLQPVLEQHRRQGCVCLSFRFNPVSSRPSLLSDIDIAVYTSNKKKSDFLEIKFALYADFCRALNRNDIDVVLLNTAKNTLLLENIVKEGVILFETPGGETIRKDFELRFDIRPLISKASEKESWGSNGANCQ